MSAIRRNASRDRESPFGRRLPHIDIPKLKEEALSAAKEARLFEQKEQKVAAIDPNDLPPPGTKLVRIH